MAEAIVSDAITPWPVGETDQDEDCSRDDKGEKDKTAETSSKQSQHSVAPSQEPPFGDGHRDMVTHDSTDWSRSRPDTSFVEDDFNSRRTLTIHRPPRVIAQQGKVKKATDDLGLPSRAITVVKWMVTFVVFSAFLACLTISKLCLLRIGNDFQNSTKSKLAWSLKGATESVTKQSTKSQEAKSSYTAETDFWMLVFIMIIPYGTTFLRSMWCGGFRSDKPWPCWKAFGWGVLSSLLESFGLSLFTVIVLRENTPYVSLLLMNAVFLLPILLNLFTKCRSPARDRCSMATFLLALVFYISGVVLVVLSETLLQPSQSQKPSKTAWSIPVSLLCLSIAWSPVALRAQLIPQRKKLEELVRTSSLADTIQINENEPTPLQEPVRSPGIDDEDNILPASEDETVTLLPPEEGQHLLNPWDIVVTHPQLSARWKSSMINSFLKMLFIPGFSILLGYFLDVVTIDKLVQGLQNINPEHGMFVDFMLNIFLSLGGYLLGWGACVMCMQVAGFALPLTFATPVALILVMVEDICEQFMKRECPSLSERESQACLAAALCLYAAQLLSVGIFIYRTQTPVMQKESKMFWVPGYSGVFLEQWLLLDRKNVHTAEAEVTADEIGARTHILMCTTMYRETSREMEQLLQSIKAINVAKQESGRNIESHIIFDSAVRDSRPTEFPLQLISAAKKVLGLTIEGCTKVLTPYGMKLTWELQTVVAGKKGMAFYIHLKDNAKVKRMKRWSQVMYMSYVLDHYMREEEGVTDDNTFVLTTDGDVRFSPQSVEALLDRMTRDSTVGAVCARTHPMGSGPVVWYQIFDYAIGHWLQKSANDVLGSVLCCPGCFSVYRAAALRDILTTYASPVNEASDFLTKDMGEDRWLCSLMVQSGWNLEYCAAASDSTYCPEDFDEFFKQRRRWIPSTLANQLRLLTQWKVVTTFNKRMSFVFLLYQATLFFSTLITPSVCVLIIVGGLYYSWGINQVLTTAVLILTVVVFTVICLNASQATQLSAAKVLTILFAIIMAAVTVGIMEQIVGGINSNNEDGSTTTRMTSTTTATSKTHSTKPVFLPGVVNSETWLDSPVSASDQSVQLPASVSTLYLAGLVGIFLVTALLHLPEAYCLLHGIWYLLCLPGGNLVLMVYSICNLTDRSWGRSYSFNVDGAREEVASIRAWLPKTFRGMYADKFEANGYEDTSFVGGMTDGELVNIGVKSKAHRNALLDAVKKLPEPEIDPLVPENVDVWLEMIGLDMYRDNFRRSHIISKSSMEILKAMNRSDLTAEVGISKQGHLKRLMLAISKLRYPSETERSSKQIKYELEALKTFRLSDVNRREHDFWEDLREGCLLPDSMAFAHDHDLREKLVNWRNSMLMVFAISNTIWIVVTITLMNKGSLNVLETNVLGLVFLSIFSLVLCIQFFCMIIHRVATFMHLIARAPYLCGRPFNDAWSFHDKDKAGSQETADSSDLLAAQMKTEYNEEMRRRYRQRVNEKMTGRRLGVARKNETRVTRSEQDSQKLLEHDPSVNSSIDSCNIPEVLCQTSVSGAAAVSEVV